MICEAGVITESELERLRVKRLRYERMNGTQATTPMIKMIVGDWYVDEFGVRTREITARE